MSTSYYILSTICGLYFPRNTITLMKSESNKICTPTPSTSLAQILVLTLAHLLNRLQNLRSDPLFRFFAVIFSRSILYCIRLLVFVDNSRQYRQPVALALRFLIVIVIFKPGGGQHRSAISNGRRDDRRMIGIEDPARTDFCGRLQNRREAPVLHKRLHKHAKRIRGRQAELFGRFYKTYGPASHQVQTIVQLRT